MLTLYQLRNLDLLRMDIGEMVEASTSVRLYVAEYETHRLDVPEWLVARQGELGRDLKGKREEQLALRLEQAQQRLRSTQTREERRKAAEDEIALLEAELQTT